MRSGAIQRAVVSPYWVNLTKKWSACMSESGYNFLSGSQALNEATLGQGETASATEIQIAVADAKCRLTMDWGQEWLNVVSSYEQAILEQYPDMLPAYREARAALLRKSAAVVAANS